MINFPKINFFSPEDLDLLKKKLETCLPNPVPGFFENFDPKKEAKTALSRLIKKHLPILSLTSKGLGKLDRNRAYYPLVPGTQFRELTLQHNPFLAEFRKEFGDYTLHLLYISWIWVKDKLSFPEWVFFLTSTYESSLENFYSRANCNCTPHFLRSSYSQSRHHSGICPINYRKIHSETIYSNRMRSYCNIICNQKSSFIYFFATRCWELLQMEIHKESGSNLHFEEWKQDQDSDEVYLEPRWYREITGCFFPSNRTASIAYEFLRPIIDCCKFPPVELDYTSLYFRPYNTLGAPLLQHISTNPLQLNFEGLFVIDLDQKFYYARENQHHLFSHSSFLGGRPVLCAGTFSFKNGYIAKLSNNSGHYTPKAVHLKNALNYFVKIGFTYDENTEITLVLEDKLHLFISSEELLNWKQKETLVLKKQKPLSFSCEKLDLSSLKKVINFPWIFERLAQQLINSKESLSEKSNLKMQIISMIIHHINFCFLMNVNSLEIYKAIALRNDLLNRKTSIDFNYLYENSLFLFKAVVIKNPLYSSQIPAVDKKELYLLRLAPFLRKGFYGFLQQKKITLSLKERLELVQENPYIEETLTAKEAYPLLKEMDQFINIHNNSLEVQRFILRAIQLAPPDFLYSFLRPAINTARFFVDQKLRKKIRDSFRLNLSSYVLPIKKLQNIYR